MAEHCRKCPHRAATPTERKIAIQPRRLAYPALVAAYFASSAYVLLSGGDRWFLGPVCLLFLLVPPIGERLFRLKLGGPLRFSVILFCLLGYNLGTALRWFDHVYRFDDFVHFLSGILFTVIGLCFYSRLSPVKGRRKHPLFQITYAFFFSMFVAVIWEIFEFLGFVLLGHDSQHHLTTGVFDTMEDIIACFLGSLVVALDYWVYQRRGRAVIMKLVRSFDKANDLE